MVGLCLLLFVLVFIIFMYLQGIEVPNVAFGLAGALIGILTKCNQTIRIDLKGTYTFAVRKH